MTEITITPKIKFKYRVDMSFLSKIQNYKSIKEFTFYIKRYLSYKKERKFVLNKVIIILIKEINEKFILEISNNKI